MRTAAVRAQGDVAEEFPLPILVIMWLSLNENGPHG